MPGLKPRPAREICGILSQYGFEQVRQSGSHIVMQARKEDASTVPIETARWLDIVLLTCHRLFLHESPICLLFLRQCPTRAKSPSEQFQASLNTVQNCPVTSSNNPASYASCSLRLYSKLGGRRPTPSAEGVATQLPYTIPAHRDRTLVRHSPANLPSSFFTRKPHLSELQFLRQCHWPERMGAPRRAEIVGP